MGFGWDTSACVLDHTLLYPGKAECILQKFGMSLGTHHLRILQESWISCICMCAGAQSFSVSLELLGIVLDCKNTLCWYFCLISYQLAKCFIHVMGYVHRRCACLRPFSISEELLDASYWNLVCRLIKTNRLYIQGMDRWFLHVCSLLVNSFPF